MNLIFYCQESAPANSLNYLEVGASGTVGALILATRGLAARGNEVHVLNRSESGIYGGVIHHLTRNEEEMKSHLSALGAPDVFVASGSAVSCLLSGRIPARKTVYWAHNFVDQRAYNQAISEGRIDHVVCVSQNQLGTWWRSRHFDRFFQIYNAVDVDAVAKFSGNSKGEKKIAFVGAPRACKGFDDAVRVFLAFREAFPEFELVVAGSAGLHGVAAHAPHSIFEPEYERDVLAPLIYDQRRNLKPGITLLGSVSKGSVWRNVASSQAILVNPSWTSQPETQSSAAMEAQLLGVPVVSTFRGGLPEVVANGRSGVLTRQKGINVLAGALKLVIESEDRRLAMGGAGRRKMERGFSVGRIAERWEMFFACILRNDRFRGNYYCALRRKVLRRLALG